MKNEEYAVILFHTSNHAFRAESILKDVEIDCKLVPVPRHLSSDCGVCARIPAKCRDLAVEVLKSSSVVIDGTHSI